MRFMVAMIMAHDEKDPVTAPALRFTDDESDFPAMSRRLVNQAKKRYPELRGKFTIDIFELGRDRWGFPTFYSTWNEGEL